jgi:hypothetical protein
MSTNSFVGFVLVGATALGAGYWIGRQHSAPSARSSASLPAQSAGGTVRGRASLPPVRKTRLAAKPGDADGKLSLAEIEAKIQGMKQGDPRLWKEWQRILDSVAPADIPALLAFLEKTPTAVSQEVWRMSLLGRWAESDASSAMAYADTVGGKQAREQAILTVLQSWGETDPEGAAAWARQLPPGQLRNQAIGAVIGMLAATNPEAALDLMQSSGVKSAQWGYVSSVFNAWAAQDPAAAAA